MSEGTAGVLVVTPSYTGARTETILVGMGDVGGAIAARAAAKVAQDAETTAVASAATAVTKAGEASASASSASTSAQTATTKASEAGASAQTAITKAAEASQDADDAADSAAAALAAQEDIHTNWQDKLDAADEAATTATTQAGIATTQAGIATTQAGIATTQAGIATNASTTAVTAAAKVISLLDYIPAQEHAAIKARTSTYDCNADLTTALAALASTGGRLYVPSGRYYVRRGVFGLHTPVENIAGDNITIYGDGRGSEFYGEPITYDPASASYRPGLYYSCCLFHARNRANLSIRNIAVTGHLIPALFNVCTNVLVDGLYADGWVSTPSTYLCYDGVYFYACPSARVVNSTFLNYVWGVYLGTTLSYGGLTAGSCGTATVSNCHFEITRTSGYKANFPAGVYAFNVKTCIVTHCTFRNIYSDVLNGNSGDGTGYGVYEGDAQVDELIVANNFISLEAEVGDNRTAAALLMTTAKEAVISGNIIKYTNTTKDYTFRCTVFADAAVDWVIQGNTIQTYETGINCDASLAASNFAHKIRISDNIIRCLSPNGRSRDYSGMLVRNVYGDIDISGNTCSGGTYGIQVLGVSTRPSYAPTIVNNRIADCRQSGILLSSYVVGAVISRNTIANCNLDALTTEAGAAIRLSGFSFGSRIQDNTIYSSDTNPVSYGVTNGTSASDRMFKDIVSGNTIIGRPVYSLYNRFWTASPTNGIFDVYRGDVILNATPSPSTAPSWHCVATYSLALTADASSASTTVTVSSTSGLTAGDIVLITKTTTPHLSADYYTTSAYHADTIASVTNGTQFVLTTGIPAGDGTYVAGTAIVKVARFKAAASLAA